MSSEGVVPHPFVAFFTSFSRAKAAACWLSERGEEVYVHRFRANKSVEGKWHPLRCACASVTLLSFEFGVSSTAILIAQERQVQSRSRPAS